MYNVVMKEMDWSGSGYVHVTGLYVYGNEVLDSIEKSEFFDYLRKY
jgi:hypothetical protein